MTTSTKPVTITDVEAIAITDALYREISRLRDEVSRAAESEFKAAYVASANRVIACNEALIVKLRDVT